MSYRKPETFFALPSMPIVNIISFEDFDDKMDSFQEQLAKAGIRNCDAVLEKFIFEWGPRGARKKGDGVNPGWKVFEYDCKHEKYGGLDNFPVIIAYDFMDDFVKQLMRKEDLPDSVRADFAARIESAPAPASRRVPIKTSGQVQRGSTNCVVSFPGDHANEWNTVLLRSADPNAQYHINGQGAIYGGPDSDSDDGLPTPIDGNLLAKRGLNSSACVFLEEGTGPLHSRNPNQPGGCMCSWLYGSNPRVRPMLKDGKAPWGCMWFSKWRQNVQKAVEDKQELWCFYTLMNRHNFVHEIELNPRSKYKFDDYFREEERLVHSGKVRRYIGNSQQAEVRWIQEKYGIKCRMWPIALVDDKFIRCFNSIMSCPVEYQFGDAFRPDPDGYVTKAYFRLPPMWVDERHCHHTPAQTN